MFCPSGVLCLNLNCLQHKITALGSSIPLSQEQSREGDVKKGLAAENLRDRGLELLAGRRLGRLGSSNGVARAKNAVSVNQAGRGKGLHAEAFGDFLGRVLKIGKVEPMVYGKGFHVAEFNLSRTGRGIGVNADEGDALLLQISLELFEPVEMVQDDGTAMVHKDDAYCPKLLKILTEVMHGIIDAR